MTKQVRSCARFAAALAMACSALRAAPAAAQDPPPPLLPAEPTTPLPPPPPSPDAPPPEVATPTPPDTTPPLAPTAPTVTPKEPAPAPPPPRAPETRRESARTLGGLAFVSPFLIDSAFTQTHAGFGLELGHQTELGVVPPAPSSSGAVAPFQYDRSLGVTTQYLSFGFAIGERVELGFSAGYATQLSSDVDGALFFGGKSTWNLRPGARVRLIHRPSTGTQLAVHVYGDFGASAWQNPAGVLAEIATEATLFTTNPMQLACLQANNISCALTSPTFNAQVAALTNRTQYGAGATVGLAQHVAGGFGVQAAVGFEADYASVSAAGTTYGSVPVAFHVGVAPSFDLGAVPLTLMAEYLFTLIDETTVSSQMNAMDQTADTNTLLTLENAAVFGAYYTGRRDLTVGALFSATFDRITATGSDGTALAQPPVTRLAGQVNARYFF
jgi:hypothetical protein